MTRHLIALGLAMAGFSASGQTTSAPAGLDEQSPQENARMGRVAERAPGRIIDEARSRHSGLRDNRLEYQHTGIAESDGTSSDGTTSSSSSTGGLDTSSLSNLLGSFLSGGGLNLLQGSNLFGSTSGGSTSTSTSTNSNIPSNITPEVIQMLQGAGIDINDVFPADSGTAKTQARQQSSDAQISNILLDRWPNKSSQTAQTATSDDEYDNDPNFRIRWSNAMLSTLFTSLVVGMQTPEFINLIKDAIRPAIQGITNTGDASAASKTSTERTRLFPRAARLRAAISDARSESGEAVEPVRATRMNRPVRAVTPR